MTDTNDPVSTAVASLLATERAPERDSAAHRGQQEAQLALGVAKRDSAALSRFYESHVDGLYAFVMCRVRGDAALAEDVVQDTFVAALDRVGSYDPERGSLRAWLWTLSRNVLRRHLRQHPRLRALGDAGRAVDAACAELWTALADAELGDELLERRETEELVTAAIANVAPAHRRVLERKYVDGRSLDELAAELEITVEAVKSLLARARRAFRGVFAAMAAEAADGEPHPSGSRSESREATP